MNNGQQMELGFEARCPGARPGRQRRRLTRARWWFQQMRLAVGDTLHWGPAPAGRPQQTYLTLAQQR